MLQLAFSGSEPRQLASAVGLYGGLPTWPAATRQLTRATSATCVLLLKDSKLKHLLGQGMLQLGHLQVHQQVIHHHYCQDALVGLMANLE